VAPNPNAAVSPATTSRGDRQSIGAAAIGRRGGTGRGTGVEVQAVPAMGSVVAAASRNANGSNNIPVRDLASFGLVPAPIRADEGSNGNQHTAEIWIVGINGVDGHSDILFRCQPTG
jgi:hypothetical protein